MNTSLYKHIILNLFTLLLTFHSYGIAIETEAPATSNLPYPSLDKKITSLFMVNMSNDSLFEEGIQIISHNHVGGVMLEENTPKKLKQQIARIRSIQPNNLFIAIKENLQNPIISLDPKLSLQATEDSIAYYYGILQANYLKAVGANIYISESIFDETLDINSSSKIEQTTLESYFHKSNLFWKGIHKAHIIGIRDISNIITINKGDNISVVEEQYKKIHHPQVHNQWKGTFFNYNQSNIKDQTIQSFLHDPILFSTYNFIDINNITKINSRANQKNIAIKSIIEGNEMVLINPNQWRILPKITQKVTKVINSKSRINATHENISELYKWSQKGETKEVARLEKIEKVFTEYFYRKTLVLLKDKNNEIPAKNLGTTHFAAITFGIDSLKTFVKRLQSYTHFEEFRMNDTTNITEVQEFLNHIDKNSHIILAIGQNTLFDQRDNEILNNILNHKNIHLVWFREAKDLLNNIPIEKISSLLLGSSDSNENQSIVAQSIMGANKIDGRLASNMSNLFSFGEGLSRENMQRLGFTSPEFENIDSQKLQATLDSLAQLGMDVRAYPGCQILIAKDNNVIFHKTYGYHTYKEKIEVKKDDIYDWASITKVAGPTIPIMQLYEQKKISLDVPYSNYWPLWKNSNKSEFILRDILAHQAQLKPYIPLWSNTLDRHGRYKKTIIHQKKSKNYNLKIAPNLYVKNSFKDTIFSEITSSELLDEKKYTYSGLAFFTFPQMIELVTHQSYEMYLRDSIYRPLGAMTVTYNPYKYFAHNRYVPTENDQFFRKRLIVGYVHDEGAALMGGVSGNAGLFGDVLDCAKIFQMFLNKGKYGDTKFLEEKTIREFTKCQFPENENRRGLAFDKPLINNSDKSIDECYPAYGCSADSFGHGGFTGTFAWADPKGKILFIFFSNRVYPTRKDKILYELNLRPQMQQVIYNLLDSVDFKKELS